MCVKAVNCGEKVVVCGIMSWTNKLMVWRADCRERWRPAGVLADETGRRDAGAPRLNLTGGTRSATFGDMIRGGFLKFNRWRLLAGLGIALFGCGAAFAQPAPRLVEPGPLASQPSDSLLPGARQMLHGHVPAVVSRLAPTGRLPAATNLSLAIGLPLRNEAGAG